jgi:hypothetical protein|tara:strand:- start:1559 stop:1690 length:132 start_codon:yes stop_codon:yes gene_type:complete
MRATRQVTTNLDMGATPLSVRVTVSKVAISPSLVATVVIVVVL